MPHAPEGPALPHPEQLRAGRRVGMTAGALGCVFTLLITYALTEWEFLRSFWIALAVAVTSVLAMGRVLGPRLAGPAHSQVPPIARGPLIALATLAAAALIGATTQIVVEHLTPMLGPFRGSRLVKEGAILLGTLYYVMLIGSLPAVAIGAVAALRLDSVRLRIALEGDDPAASNSHSTRP